MYDDVISRSWLLEQIQDLGNTTLLKRNFIALVENAPVRHGMWKEYPRAHYFKCSECKYTVPYRKAVLINGKREYNFCPSCGARMDVWEPDTAAAFLNEIPDANGGLKHPCRERQSILCCDNKPFVYADSEGSDDNEI